MSADIRLRAAAGGSVTLKPDDTLTTDEEIVFPQQDNGGGQGSATAWVKYEVATDTIKASYNVASVEHLDDGKFRINFENPMDNADYIVSGMASDNISGNTTGFDMNIGSLTEAPSVNSVVVAIYLSGSASYTDPDFFTVVIHGGKS